VSRNLPLLSYNADMTGNKEKRVVTTRGIIPGYRTGLRVAAQQATTLPGNLVIVDLTELLRGDFPTPRKPFIAVDFVCTDAERIRRGFLCGAIDVVGFSLDVNEMVKKFDKDFSLD